MSKPEMPPDAPNIILVAYMQMSLYSIKAGGLASLTPCCTCSVYSIM